MYQQVIVVGNLCNDPEMRFTATGVPVTNFDVTVNRRWTNPDGTLGEETTWFRVSAWRKLADTCNTFLGKGHRILVVGRVEASAYTRHDGEPAARLEITASAVSFLGGPEPEGSRGNALRVRKEEIPF